MNNAFCKRYVSLLTFLAGSLLVQSVYAGQLYKWVDRHGNVTYQSEPPPENAQSVERPSISTEIKEQVAAQSQPEALPIKFYVKPDCPLCDQARAFFAEKGVSTTEIDITVNTNEAEVMRKQVGHDDVPTVIVGNKAITGFQENALSQILTSSGYKLTTGEAEAGEGGEEGQAAVPAEGELPAESPQEGFDETPEEKPDVSLEEDTREQNQPEQ